MMVNFSPKRSKYTSHGDMGDICKIFSIQCYRLSFQTHESNQIFRLPFQSKRGISWAPPLPEHAQTHWQCWGSPCSGCIHSTRYRGSSSLKNIRHHAFCHSIFNHTPSLTTLNQYITACYNTDALNEMANILQMAFANESSGFKFHWNLFWRIHLTISQHWLR